MILQVIPYIKGNSRDPQAHGTPQPPILLPNPTAIFESCEVMEAYRKGVPEYYAQQVIGHPNHHLRI